MKKLWIGNMAPATSDDTLREFVGKYAHDVKLVDIKRIEGDGSRPAAVLTFEGDTFEALPKLALRLDGMYWLGRKLSVAVEPGVVES